MSSNQSIVLLPCNGLSARGQLSSVVAGLLQEQLEDIEIGQLIPLSVKDPAEQARLARARFVMAISGCSQRCESHICQQAGGQIDGSICLEDDLPKELVSIAQVTPEQRRQATLTATSRALAQLTDLDE